MVSTANEVRPMILRKILLGVTEIASMGLLAGAVAFWAVALAPVH